VSGAGALADGSPSSPGIVSGPVRYAAFDAMSLIAFLVSGAQFFLYLFLYREDYLLVRQPYFVIWSSASTSSI
jgi:hypothetical protein